MKPEAQHTHTLIKERLSISALLRLRYAAFATKLLSVGKAQVSLLARNGLFYIQLMARSTFFPTTRKRSRRCFPRNLVSKGFKNAE